MVDKRFSFGYSIFFGLFMSIMTILMILLFLEYRFFCRQAREMVELKEQYAQYIHVLTKKINGDITEDDSEILVISDEVAEELLDVAEESSISMDEILAAEASDAPDDDDDYIDESFVVINRQPEYLKQSTLDYMQSQELNSLMTAIDVDRWSDYTESSFVPPAQRVQRVNKGTSERQRKGIQNKTVINPATTKPKTHITMHRSLKDCGFMWPVDLDKFWLSSLFGPRKRVDGTWGFHHGIDMAAVKGTIVKVVRAGTVVEASFQTGYGNTVVVQHSDALKTRYAHLHTIRVCVGQKIKQGTIVGTVGETGFIRKKGKDGSHLHFEVYEKGKRVNPLHCLPRAV